MRLRWLVVWLWIGAICSAAPAHGAALLRLTEWMDNGDEFVEITNVGDASLDLTNYSFGDNTELPGNVSLTPLGELAAHASALITERDAATFRAAWNLAVNLQILGSNSQNLGRADEISIYDPVGTLVDRLTYNDAAAQGPRTLNVGGNIPLGALGTNNANAAVLSMFEATLPEPSAAGALALAFGVLGWLRRRA